MDSSGDFFDKSLPKMDLSTLPSYCVYPPLRQQQTHGHPLIQHRQPTPRQAIRLGISFQTHPERILEPKHGEHENKNAVESGAEGGTPEHDTLGFKNKLGEDFDLPPGKKMKTDDKDKNREFEQWGRKKKKDEEELKEQVGELKERLQSLQKKVWKAFSENPRKWTKEDYLREEEDNKVYGEAESFMKVSKNPKEALGSHALREHWWNGPSTDSFNEEGDGEAKFAQFLKIELRSAMARVIDQVLGLYIEASESAPSSPPAAVSFLDEANEKWEYGIQKKRLQKVDDKDGKTTHGQSSEPSGSVQMSDSSMCRKLLPMEGLHHRPAVCLSEPPMLAPASRPSAHLSSFPSHDLFQSMAHLPLMHISMQELFSRTVSHQPWQPAKGFHMNADGFNRLARPSLPPPVPLVGLLEPGQSEGRVEVGMRGTGGAMDLFFTAGSQEGLSPCHLKKAKLMFFYTRYPSSSTLKTYFPDVKFNRCVTSQMIKWFSNFREFFYIQMERFARQAVQEALTLDDGAHLSRDRRLRLDQTTELCRILNMHYNKSNVYQVPEGFLKVSEVALREFYAAIWTGRDSDPCWKKGIYKIICKLDSPVPDEFLLPGCPVG